MYGLINKALHDMICEAYGEERWQQVLAASGVSHDAFITMRQYDDEITYKLAGAAAEVLNAPLETCLEAFGRYWILNAAPKSYESLLRLTGQDFLSFLEHVNALHDRITTTFLNYVPPTFFLEREDGRECTLRYESQRQGLTPFVTGLLHGLAERFDTAIEILSLDTAENDSGEVSDYRLRLGD